METEKKPLTKAQKTKRQKETILAVLKEKDYKWNELLDVATARYVDTYPDEEIGDKSDLKGKLGSAFSLLSDAGEVVLEKPSNLCKLIGKDEKEKSKKAKKTEKAPAEKKEDLPPVSADKGKKAKAQEKPPKKTKEEKAKEKADLKEKKAKAKAQKQAQKAVAKIDLKREEPLPISEKENLPDKKEEEKKADKKEEGEIVSQKAVSEKKENALTEKKPDLTDFVFLGNSGKEEKKEEEPLLPKPSTEKKNEEEANAKKEGRRRAEEEKRNKQKNVPYPQARGQQPRSQTEDEILKGTFLRKLRSLGGEYFEYYCVYLMERYARRNGRRIEAFRVCGGKEDGGIDGEIELTDKFGFRETIYIQAKNWNPTGKEWLVGETLLRQFVGAVSVRKLKEGAKSARGIFITASRFTDGAREILSTMSEDFVGYDEDDLFDTAKECSFGLVQKNGKWYVDENLLSGTHAFFNLD